MAEKSKGLGIPQTKGYFEVRGKVSGTTKEKFYTETLTKTNKNFRMVNFGVQFAPESTMYVGLNGMERDNVYFSKRDEETKVTETKKVPWANRFTFNEEGFLPIGVNVGVRRIFNEKGDEVNDNKVLFDYDACKEIGDNLVDDKTVYVRGNIEYSTYQGAHQTRFSPKQVSLGKDIDFETDDFKPQANFTQTIVYMGTKPSDDKTYATVEAKIVNYNSIEDAEFKVKDMSLARMFSKTLKPYTSIKVWGDIEITKNIEEVETTDCWGTKNAMDKVKAPTKRDLVIIGANPDTIDTTTYSEAEIDKAIEQIKAAKQAESDFGGSNSNTSWGTLGTATEEDDDLGW